MGGLPAVTPTGSCTNKGEKQRKNALLGDKDGRRVIARRLGKRQTDLQKWKQITCDVGVSGYLVGRTKCAMLKRDAKARYEA